MTVLVFKDNQTSRSFRVPLGWISRLGFVLALGLGLMIGGTVITVRLYRSSLVSEPTRIRELEAQLAEYQGQAREQEDAPEYAPPAEGRLPLVPSDVAEPYAPFRALPEGVKLASGEAAQSVEIRNIEVSVKEPKVILKFWLLNTRRSGGTQQGRIIILARGSETLLAYPRGVLASAGAPALIDPQRGEFFSISKFRETSAEFELRPDRGQERLREFEVYILGKGDEIILVKRIPFSLPGSAPQSYSPPRPAPQESVPAAPPPARPKPAVPAEPAVPEESVAAPAEAGIAPSGETTGSSEAPEGDADGND
ncbi:MAG: hypothetical protein IT285_00530 [Bdellovibrionales bacterium]|nr:hypothetical protein [Bdellovibrionales bacterium]